MGLLSRSISLFLILFLLIFFILIGFLSYLFQGWPIIYSQERIGYKFKKFKIYKFRTMKNELSIKTITTKNDSRVTTWGKFLRMTKIDEFPQLINILKGDMRFVGPRPEVKKYVNTNDFFYLNQLKPGITDFSSIIFRNESSLILSDLDYDNILSHKNRLAAIYSVKKSFILDLYLVCLTLLSIFFSKISRALVIRFLQKIDKNLVSEIKKIIKA